jgi:serine/threonine-protein kinase SRPK3
MWSLACLVFELATGDLLFDPRAGKDYERDDDHLALVSELCGRVPRRVWSAGKRGKEFFNRAGELRRIRKLRFWPLDAVLREKYGFSKEEASFFFFSSLFSLFFSSFCFSPLEREGKRKRERRKKKTKLLL